MNDRVHLANTSPMTFAGSPLDRGELIRRDTASLQAAFERPDARCIRLCEGRPAMDENHRLIRFKMSDTSNWDATGPMIYLGSDDAGPLFACEIQAEEKFSNAIDPRQAAMNLPHLEAAIFAQAKSVFAWREKNRFCANCGQETRQSAGGAKRVCDGCQSEHFPRVDPVVIMLATYEDKCLLGRQGSWPEGVWSALAGFVEPAETLEEACARELQEEAGVRADIAGIRYVMTQPWPMPHSLMVGLVAPVLSPELEIDTHELEQAKWFSRDDVRAMMEGQHKDAHMPPSIAIARRLAELWVNQAI